MKTAAILIAALLAGCSTAPAIKSDRVMMTVRESAPGELPLTITGRATWLKDKSTGITYCNIVLLRYPLCLAHEVRHCIEGAWHNDVPNMEDC